MSLRADTESDGLWVDERSVSPVIATVLMVAIVIVIAASIGAVGFGFTDRLGETSVAANDGQCIQSVGFDPNNVDSFADSATADLNCVMWFDASQESSGELSTWTDQSGNGYDANRVSGSPEVTTVEGVSAVEFGGNDDEGYTTTTTASNTDLDGDPEFTVVTLVRADAGSTGAVVQFGGTPDPDTPFAFQPDSNKWQLQTIGNANSPGDFVTPYLNAPSDSPTERWLIQTFVYDKNDISIYVNGGSEKSVTRSFDINDSKINIGYFDYNPGPEDGFEGFIAEIVILNKALNDADRKVVECAIAEKHGNSVTASHCA